MITILASLHFTFKLKEPRLQRGRTIKLRETFIATSENKRICKRWILSLLHRITWKRRLLRIILLQRIKGHIKRYIKRVKRQVITMINCGRDLRLLLRETLLLWHNGLLLLR